MANGDGMRHESRDDGDGIQTAPTQDDGMEATRDGRLTAKVEEEAKNVISRPKKGSWWRRETAKVMAMDGEDGWWCWCLAEFGGRASVGGQAAERPVALSEVAPPDCESHLLVAPSKFGLPELCLSFYGG
jgi:hypothetical protein